MPDSPDYMLIHEVADLVRIPVATLYQWRVTGDGPSARKLGRRLVYRRDEVVAWVESKVSTSNSAA